MSTQPDISFLQKHLPLNRGVRVLGVSAAGLVALEKPCEVKTHPNSSAADKTALLNAHYDLKQERYHWKNPPTAPEDAPSALWILNRLDSPTSGVVMAALNASAAQAGRACFEKATAEKIYYALVRGAPRPPKGLWKDRLNREKKEGTVRVTQGGIMEALCEYVVKEVSKKFPGLCLLRLKPLTGRTHQLRVQCAAHGHPILGDRSYGDFSWNKQLAKTSAQRRLFLHCAATRLSIKTPTGIDTLTAESPLPGSFTQMQ